MKKIKVAIFISDVGFGHMVRQREVIYLLLKKIKNIEINKRSNFSSPLWHLLIIKLKSFNLSKKEIFMRYLFKNKIATQIHYIPIYKHKPFIKDICFSKKGAEEYFKEAVTLPFHLKLSKKDVDYIVLKISAFFKKNK